MKKHLTPIVLMVSGGSDSTALLELAAMHASSQTPKGPTGKKLLELFAAALPSGDLELACLHINHQLRGAQADADEAFVANLCSRLQVPFTSKRIDVNALSKETKAGIEATAREARYQAAFESLGLLCQKAKCAPEDGLILTAHTLDDRVETFFMRSMVGTGPGGLGSIPRRRGQVLRPLLDAQREELREFLREEHPGVADEDLWREDPTNNDGSNFRSRVRTQLIPVMNQLQPGFQHNLARTMDLLAEEDAIAQSRAEGIVYRSLSWDGETAQMPVSALAGLDLPLLRRVLRQSLLVVDPDARLEARQIQRVADAVIAGDPFATEVDAGIRVCIQDGMLLMRQL